MQWVIKETNNNSAAKRGSEQDVFLKLLEADESRRLS